MNPIRFNEPVIKVVNEDGHQFLYFNGQKLPRLVWTRVYNGCDEPSYVIAKFFVNIEDSPVHYNPYILKPIEDLPFKRRTLFAIGYNPLFEIKTVENLISYREDELMRMRNFGKQAITDIKSVLMNHGLSLKH